MQFNNGTESILSEIDFICDTSSTSYPTDQKTRNVNRWAYKAHVAQIQGSHRWQIDDSNLTTLPRLTTTLVAGQADYTLPTDMLRIERVEVLNANGDYERLQPIDSKDIHGAYDEFEETDGMPRYYDLVGNNIILMPAPAADSVTTSGGLKIHVLREIDIFTTSDTTHEPSFPEPFHRIVTYGPSFDYLLARGDYKKAQSIRNEVEMLLQELRDFTGQMQGEEHIRIRPGHRTVSYL
jgi:hypothetical protein